MIACVLIHVLSRVRMATWEGSVHQQDVLSVNKYRLYPTHLRYSLKHLVSDVAWFPHAHIIFMRSQPRERNHVLLYGMFHTTLYGMCCMFCVIN